MDAVDEVTTHILLAAVVAILVAAAYRGARHGERLRRLLAEDPTRRIRLYRASMLGSWAMAVLVPVIVLTSTDLSAQDVGWAWPDGDGFDYVLTLVLVISSVVSAVRRRQLVHSGRLVPDWGAPGLLIPRTPAERRTAVGVGITAGITEEAIFRGLLIAAGTEVYHLPLGVAALASLALFAAGHTYQGKPAVLSAALLGTVYTVIYVISGSILLVVVAHAVQDLAALLLTPPPTAGQAAPDRAEPPAPASRP